MRIRIIPSGLLLVVPIVVLAAAVMPACAARQATLRDSALVVNELALAASRVEQRVFDEQLISKASHDAIGVPILRVLQAANAYSQAVQAGADGSISRAELVSSLTDAIEAAADVGAVRLALEQLRNFLE